MVQIKEEVQRQYKQTLGMFMAVSTRVLGVVWVQMMTHCVRW